MHFAPPLKGLPLELGIGAGSEKARMMGYQKVKKFFDRFSHLDTIPACDRRTDRHVVVAKTALWYASRG